MKNTKGIENQAHISKHDVNTQQGMKAIGNRNTENYDSRIRLRVNNV